MLKITRIKKTVLAFILITLFILSTGCNLVQMKPEAIKKQVVAKIEDHKILKHDFNLYLFLEKLSWQIQGQTFPSEGEQLENIKNSVLDNLVQNEMLIYLAKQEEIPVDEEIVENQLIELKEFLISDLGGEEEYEKTLEDNNLTDTEFEEFLKRYFSMNQYIEGLIEMVTKDVSVDEQEAKEFYDENQVQFDPSTAKAKHILVNKENETLAKEISKRGKAGEDFDKLMEEFQGNENILEASDLGEFNKAKMIKEFSDATFALEEGEVSDIVESFYGYHIIKLEEKDEKPVKQFDEVKEEITMQLELSKKQEEFSKYMQQKQEELKIEKYPNKL
ncbi:MAG TPA: hypothetical protein GXZ78_03525 [Eubacteriaceae bacterium]|nr:hypothetical protein [Eubacteriaceae bacterium]